MKVFLVCHSAKVHLPLQGGYQRGMFERHLKPVESPDDESYQSVFKYDSLAEPYTIEP